MKSRTQLGSVLVNAGLISEQQLQSAEAHTEGESTNVIDQLVSMGACSEAQIANALAAHLQLPVINLTQIVADPELLQGVPKTLAERYELVPVRKMEDAIGLAMADPTDIVAIDDAKLAAGVSRVSVAVAPLAEIREARSRLYEVDAVASQLLGRLGVAGEVEVLPEDSDAREDEEFSKATKDGMAPVIGLVNAILADAVRARATDVHIEPTPTRVDVRYRVDGLLREVLVLPKHLQALVVSRLKVISGMDIADRRRPQDGRTRIVVEGQKVDLRISSIPTLPGEKIVARLLYKGGVTFDLDSLGMEEADATTLRRALATPQGLIAFTGPTGSGKTSTMYGSLLQLRSPERNMIALEDPIEYELEGLSQVQIDDKSGISFARGLRSVLRQDPDVIMVGEIRDQETAQIVMQAALTGHLVLSSLHTNDAASAITRLVDLGVEPYLVSSGLSLVIAQRLARLICTECKIDAGPSGEAAAILGLSEADVAGLNPKKGAGCDACGYTGYCGRTGIYEVLPITQQVREQIDAQLSETALVKAARAAGVRSLRESGINKVRAGLTTLEEVLRVTHTEIEHADRCPNCRQEVEEAFVICPYCQWNLRASSCPTCRESVKPEWRICPYCESVLPRSEVVASSVGLPRVLVVDDDEAQVRLARRGLSERYEVIEAHNGEQAIREASLRRPDLIVLDLHLPDMTGVEVTKRLRESAATSMIPVIMLTGSTLDEDEMAGLRAGVDDYLHKPYDFARLKVRIENLITRSESVQGLKRAEPVTEPVTQPFEEAPEIQTAPLPPPPPPPPRPYDPSG